LPSANWCILAWAQDKAGQIYRGFPQGLENNLDNLVNTLEKGGSARHLASMMGIGINDFNEAIAKGSVCPSSGVRIQMPLGMGAQAAELNRMT
jgi:hypothetical protein